jgi:hypothetical protein
LWRTSKPKNFKEFWLIINSEISYGQDGSVVLQEIVEDEEGPDNETSIKLQYINSKGVEVSVSKKQVRDYMTEFKKKR